MTRCCSMLTVIVLGVIVLGCEQTEPRDQACLITKTDTNPFFVKMREGATLRAAELGIRLSTHAGRVDGDHETQVRAVETCIAAGVDGILISASDSRAITEVLGRAREQGILVIALDTPLNPPDAADLTFATDNFEAGRLIGAWARATLGDAAEDARIALLGLSPSQPSVDVLRNQGFLAGFGIDIADPDVIGDEDDSRIVGLDVTGGNEEGGRTAMENLLQLDPGINLVYTMNEPSAAGAHEALRSFGRDDGVIVVSVDGGCAGVRNVGEGVIGATSQQYPLRMATLGIEALRMWLDQGAIPMPTEGLDFVDTGVSLVTGAPVGEVPSISVGEGLELCWG